MRNKKTREDYTEMEELEMTEPEVESEVVGEEIPIQEPDVIAEPDTGTVVNCGRLRLRKGPSKESEVVQLLKIGEGVFVDLANSNDEWLKIRTVDGAEGFCMREYISI